MMDLLLPPEKRGPGVLLVHAWWGLNQTIRDYGAALAREGFVVGLPDLFEGENSASIEGAQQLTRNHGMKAEERLAAAIYEFVQHEAVQQDSIGAVGFSFGASALLDAVANGDTRIGRLVIYYATYPMTGEHPPILAHLAEADEFESDADMAAMSAAARSNGDAFSYAGTRHWFAEADRREYDAAAAEAAFGRSVTFLRG